MTKEEAIRLIGWLKCTTNREDDLEALDMAIEALSAKPTISMFAESEEAYKAWTGEEMGGTSDEINKMNKEIIKDILKMMPTAYLLEALGVSTFEELTEQADRPQGEWIVRDYDMKLICPICGETFTFDDVDELLNFKEYAKYCLTCGAKMGGDGE